MVNAVEFMTTVQLCASSVQNLLPLDSIIASLCKLSGRPPTSLFALLAGLLYSLAAALYHRNGVEFLVEGADSLGVSVYLFGIAAAVYQKTRTTNVKGKISSFWRYAAAAALRHQKQSEDTTNQKSYSSSPTSSGIDTEEAALRRTLTNLFQISWPTYQQVSCWQHSFQNLLQDEHGILIFREFLQGEFSDENLEFWIACQKYKYLTDVFMRKQRAQEIYDGFIAFQSQREVNLDCETRIQTEARLGQAEPDLFDASQKRIEALMEKDPYRRFLRSNLFLKLLDKCQKLENTSPNSPEDDPNDSNSITLADQVSESTAADEVSLKSRLAKTKPSQSIDLGDLKVVSVKLAKS
nr:regulator of G protein signaling 3 [Hymenolepis microstoma]